jgi:hypothetical protein
LQDKKKKEYILLRRLLELAARQIITAARYPAPLGAIGGVSLQAFNPLR